MNQIIIGLAGHIDHGKTSLVEGLTGVNTDKMKEEIQRGMTIDIGFAFLSEQVTLIDVPGHKRFIKNMMTGVSSVDAAILVIAADDGIMQQTREHLDILTLLGVKKGIIVLNKIDLVDDEWMDLVELDIQDLVKTTFLNHASIIRVSASKKIGFNLLKKDIKKICDSIEEKIDRGVFRMPVDRVFTKRGFGTVITGTVASGSLEKGKSIQVLTSGLNVKVRNIQSHGKLVNNVIIGDRAAVNFQGLDADKIHRGCQLVSPGYFLSTKQIGAFIKTLNSIKKPITQNQRIRIHIGTQEVMARISLVEMGKLLPGETSTAFLKLESPITASIGDKFIIRSYSPISTIAGGEIIDNEVSGKWAAIKTYLKNIYNFELGLDIPYMIEAFGSKPMTKEKMKLKFGYSESNLKIILDKYLDIYWARINRDEWLVTKNQIINLKEIILKYLKMTHKKYPYKEGLQREEIRQYLNGDERFVEFLLSKMLSEGSISRKGENFGLVDHSIQLSSVENKKLEMLLRILNDEGFYSSNQKELAKNIGITEDEVKKLLDVGSRLEKIIRVNGKLYFTKSKFINLKMKLIEYFQNNELMSISDFKEITGTSRKYAVPLLEYFDKLKITYRDGNNRKIIQRKNVKV